MQEHCDTTGGTAPSDTELVRRIRAAAGPGGRLSAGPYGAPVPDGEAGAGEEALNEFHRRHYAAVLAYARSCCRSSQAAADLTKEAINGVLHSPGPEAASDAAWRDSLLAAVRHTAAAWHQHSRNTELRDDFASWLAAQPGEGTGPADGGRPADGDGRPSGAGGVPTAGMSFSGTVPSAAPDKPRRAWFSPARITVLAVAVVVLAGVAISAGSLFGPSRHDAEADGPAPSGHTSAPAPDRSPTTSPKGSASASRSASGSPDPTRSAASKHPKPRHPSPKKPSSSARPGHKNKPPGHTTSLTARQWIASSDSFAPARLNSSIDGHPLTIQGAVYAQGLGAHADSQLLYDLGGSCSALTVDVGLDDEVGANGSVVFQIYRDTTKVADSGLMTVDQPAKRLTADLSGGSQLRLVVTDGGNGNNSDHADWGNPQLTCR
ncbi:NPCBM/NEW2 domain-containing protein [Streptomyces lydicamycinicus]|uniref:NPCBM/NEW2 domain-containing protein n=1 Tax=Streptomyces lydicamycinicus TaxID=1546107 RepID=UPI003C2FBB1B